LDTNKFRTPNPPSKIRQQTLDQLITIIGQYSYIAP